MVITRCGLDCSDCYAYPKDCPGCAKVEGKPFWTEGAKQCELYRCSSEHGFAHCGQCAELPCQMWHDLKDPSQSDEEHQQALQVRAQRLLGLASE